MGPGCVQRGGVRLTARPRNLRSAARPQRLVRRTAFVNGRHVVSGCLAVSDARSLFSRARWLRRCSRLAVSIVALLPTEPAAEHSLYALEHEATM